MTNSHPNRLKELRKRQKLGLEDLAEKTGFSPGHLSRLERGDRKLTVETLERLALALGVQPTDLLAPAAQRQIPIVGYVGAGAEVFAIDDHAKGDGIEMVDCPWSELAPSTVAVRVRGDSMAPAYFDGDLIFYEETHSDFVHLLGKECVVALADGRRFIKTLRRTQDGAWYLASHNAEPIFGVRIEWAAKVRIIQRN